MADKTKIEWTGASWTPIRARNRATGKVGWHCVHKSEGCRNCYAEGINRRLGTGLDFKPQVMPQIELFLDETMLTQPLRWKKPRKIFVCSMTDLFADFVPDEWIDRMFAVMALCPQHTFQVLTKRPERMRKYMQPFCRRRSDALGTAVLQMGYDGPLECLKWPLPNVWLGTSAERQEEADERIPELLATPAAVRFVSLEPLLAPIDAAWALSRNPIEIGAGFLRRGRFSPGLETLRPLDWVIVGGESGPSARPMHPDWVRSLRDQCAAADVAFFFKQWGEWKEAFHDRDGTHVEEVGVDEDAAAAFLAGIRYPGWITHDGRFYSHQAALPFATRCRLMERIGKKAAGRLLDGVEHSAMPGEPPVANLEGQ